MRRPLNEREDKIVELAGRLADSFAQRARQHDHDGDFPHDNYVELVDSGYLKLNIPEEFGGMGADLYETMLAQERLAMGDAATALAVNMHMSPIGQWSAIWRITKNAAIADVLRRAGAGELIWAGFTSEPGVDNIIMGAKTKATKAPGGFHLNGHKIFCTNIEIATDFTITAQYENPEIGPELIMVKTRKGLPGLEPIKNWEVLGMKSTQSGELKITDHFVPEENIIHRQPVGFFNEVIARTILCWGVSTFGAVYTGLAAGAIEWAKKIAIQRNRLQEPYVRQMFAEIEMLLEVARAVSYRHAHEVRDGLIYQQLSVQEIMARSALAKMVPVNNTIQIMNKIVEAVGAPTFQLKYDFERMWRDAQAGPLMPFSNILAYKLLSATCFDEVMAPTCPSPELEQALAHAS